MRFRIARLVAEDLDRFQAGLPAWNSTEYAKRLAAQDRGELVQVVAWDDDRPVGKAMVLFPGHDEYSESAERERCGEVRDVGVAETARRRGVATSLMAMMEEAVLEHGMKRVGLTVAQEEDDAPARALYAKLGFAVAHGPFITSTNLYGEDGRPIHVGAIMSYLTKSLVPD
ncbi:MAG: GNAT family N-acetyltransferase [Actinomycetota bacterium]